ncbi:MAG: D-alanyl-D-alanine carboxypeptidase [Methylocystis sp.]|nr:D-alanyl-D-alanine carboxypeptidase [Methylocystis sp.]MCA3583697.1 D-alanyl-D-alanine carboxypeptidase [Methylocystis sp.]MCA3587709.1 D-alanyl-D-alanine carboxypeptidase [Methylocystis sp.]MCA3590029.1 D-alanyl-D-alanine carboxypeptidase [Methylocystis sp.]
MVFFSLRRLTCLTLAISPLLALSPSGAQAQAPYIVVDAATGQVLLEEEATRPWNPASTTKMMTVFVALRAVKAGQARLDTPLVASARAAGQKPSKIGIRPGQEITLDNAIKITMVKSANDVAYVIAEAIGGSVENFSAMMNAEARRLGMTESHFVNPHGFHAGGHQSSARDLALLARALLTEFPDYQDYWSIGAVQLGNRVLNNTNGLLGRYPGANGMKTGFVCASGFNLVATADRGGRSLIVVVLGAGSGGERVLRSAQLLDRGFGAWNSSGRTLEALPRSSFATAPDMRREICSGRRRGVVLSDDSDYSGSLLANTAAGENMAGGSALAFFAGQNPQPAQQGFGGQPQGGRALLGPRVAAVPIPVYLGRAPGSTAVALAPGGRRAAPATALADAPAPGLPANATALAPPALRGAVPGLEPRNDRPSSQAAIRPTAGGSEAKSGEPLQLPGVITRGTAAAPERPSAAAAIRPRPPAPALAPPAKAQQAKVQPAKAAPAKARTAKAQAAKAAPKAQPKRKPAEDDE